MPPAQQNSRSEPQPSAHTPHAQTLPAVSGPLTRPDPGESRSADLRERLDSYHGWSRVMDAEHPLLLSGLEPGTIAACYGTDRVGRFISRWTRSAFGPRPLRLGPSHVAILCQPTGDIPPHQDGHSRLVWVESTTMCPDPCLIRGRHVSGCQAHRPERRVRHYTRAGGWVDFYRLSDIDRLQPSESWALTDLLINQFVRPGIGYDTGGALISGTRVLKLAPFLSADLDHVFCSEFLAAALQRLCRMNRDNPTRYNPGSLLRTVYRQGTYIFDRRVAA